MKKHLRFTAVALAFLCCLQGNASAAEHSLATHSFVGPSLVGQWKSNAELTLQSLNEIEGISEESLEYLKQHVLGRLTVEFTDTLTRSYFGKTTNIELRPYKVLAQSEAFIQLEHTDPLSGKIIVSSLYWENECYYELVSKWQYKEYFCPAIQKKKFIAISKSNLNN